LLESRTTTGPNGYTFSFSKYPSKTGQKPIWICSERIEEEIPVIKIEQDVPIMPDVPAATVSMTNGEPLDAVFLSGPERLYKI